MSKLYFDKNEISHIFQYSTWQHVVFKEFESTLCSDIRPFPCIFGVTGLKRNQLRFAFCEKMEAEEIAPSLKCFVSQSRNYGANTSLVVFSKPQSVLSIKTYEKRFWNLLRNLSALDDQKWPSDVLVDVSNAYWEFCFAGEPIFVVCNTPAHVLRQSRRSMSFTITFQPRWVFDRILGTPEAANIAVKLVRERLKVYDISPPSRHLGVYGDPVTREYKQYFLLENDQATSCLFQSLANVVKKRRNAV